VLAQQTTSVCSVEDYPRVDNNNNKIIFMKPEVGSAKADKAEDTLKKNTSLKSTKSSNENLERFADNVAARITYTMMPSSIIGSKAGQLLFLPQASVTGGKKRSWCVFLGGNLMMFNHPSDMKPREVIDLNTCKVVMLDNQVIKITNQDQTWYCYSPTPAVRLEWMQVFDEFKRMTNH